MASTEEETLNAALLNMSFESQSSEEILNKFDRAIEEFTDTSWKVVDYKETGNFYEKRWCKGDNLLKYCILPLSNMPIREQHLIILYTLFFTDNPEFFGLGFNAHRIPKNGWGVDFSYNEKGKSIIADSYNINLYYFNEKDEPLKSFSLSSNYEYAVYENKVHYSSSLYNVKNFLSSKEELRDHGFMQLDGALEKVYNYINSEEAVRCEYGPYLGRGIPPVCTDRKLTEAERKESISKAQEYFSEQKKILDEDYAEIYNALTETFPLEIFN